MGEPGLHLPSEICDLPVGHLQLESSAASVAEGISTIAALARACASGELPPRRTGAMQIRRMLSLLAAAIRTDPINGWDGFRKTRPRFASANALYFYSPRLRLLRAPVLRRGLATIHLSRRGINALAASGVVTVGNLITHATNGIVRLRASGYLTANEIIEALDALSTSAKEAGGVDWVEFAEARQFALLPATAQEHYSGRDFLWYFPKACEEAVVSKFGDLGRALLLRRMLRHPDIFVPLNEVSKQTKFVGERLRLLERSILKMLRRAIWNEEYRGCRFRFRPAFLQPLHSLAHQVQRAPAGCLDGVEWRRLLYDCWEVEPSDLGQQTLILFQLLGLESELPERLAIAPTKALPSDLILRASSEIQAFFARRGPRPASVREVCQDLTRSMGKDCPTEESVAAILQALPMLEREETKPGYRVSLSHLKVHVDRCERILRDRGAAMHFKDIHSEISRLAPKALQALAPRDLASRMANAKRFAPIGRTGLWTLSEWPHVETGTVADIAARLIRDSATPLNEDALFDLIIQLRPVKKTSISTLLRGDRRFRRVAPAVWELAQPELSQH